MDYPVKGIIVVLNILKKIRNMIYYLFYKYFVEDYYLHVYNSLNDNSATIKFLDNEKENCVEENKNFQESIKYKFLWIKDWDLKKIKVLHNSCDKSFLQQKIK